MKARAGAWKGRVAGAILALGTVFPGELLGQEGKFAFQIRGGGAVPVFAFRDRDQGWEGSAGTAPSLSMGFTFPFLGPVGLYLGFGQHRFRCDDEVCAGGRPWVSTGFDVALRYVLGRSLVRPWAQAGLHNHRVEGRVRDGSVGRGVASDGGGGFELGGGLLIAVAPRISVSPGVRYGEGNVPFPTEGRMRLRYLVADMGLVIGF